MNQIWSQLYLSKDIFKTINSKSFKQSNLFEFNSKYLNILPDSRNKLLGCTERRALTLEEIELFEKDYKMKVTLASFAQRAKINSRIFHSVAYTQKGKLNSYTITFKNKEEENYAKIEYFCEVYSKIFAFIKVIHFKNDSELTQILPKSSGIFLNFLEAQMKNYYKVIKSEEDSIAIIEAESIINRCLIIETQYYNFLTEIKYEFEHD